MSVTDESIQTGAIDRAGEWYARHRDGPLTTAETEAFMTWLQASPLHVGEYLAIAGLAAQIPAAVTELKIDRQGSLERALQWLRGNANVVALNRPRSDAATSSNMTKRRGTPRKVAAAAVLLTVVLGAGGYWAANQAGLSGWPRVFEVPPGEQRTVRLRDGSVMHLNADTRVRVRYSDAQRRIELDRGQALFSVARNASRPFIVYAGAAEVVAVGTQFDVSRRNAQGSVTVTVVEGKVDVIEPAAAHPLRLSGGEQVRLTRAGVVRHAEPVDLHVATAWLRREMIFSEWRLAEVAEEFSRYGVPIEIAEPKLRDYRVSGVFSTYDTESFVKFLERFGEVEQSDRGIRVH